MIVSVCRASAFRKSVKAEFFEATIFPGRQQAPVYIISIANRPEEIESFLSYAVRRSLCDRLIVMVFYRALIQGYIYLRGPEITVAKDLRNVLNRYAFADQIRCQGSAEPVRMHVAHAGTAAEILNNVLNPLLGQPPVRILESNKQSRIVIGPAAEITPEIFGTDLGEVKATLLAAFADYGGFAGNKVNTGPVQGHNLGYSETGGVEEF